MKKLLTVILLLLALAALPARPAAAHPHILRAADGGEVTVRALLDDLATVQVIFIGELHNHRGHHRAQLSIIRALHKAGLPVVVGLEMFRKESQAALDGWVGGKLPLRDFLKVYQDNWSMWEEYEEIFRYARSHQVPMIGLNISREVSGKVARQGFAALPEEERMALGKDVRCVVDPDYEEFIRRALGNHAGHGQQFLFFCEAQVLWDTMMARHLAEYLTENPQKKVVVLAGSGHNWRFGIPRQLERLGNFSYRIVLPEIDQRLNRTNLNGEVADYLWLDEGPLGWEF